MICVFLPGNVCQMTSRDYQIILNYARHNNQFFHSNQQETANQTITTTFEELLITIINKYFNVS